MCIQSLRHNIQIFRHFLSCFVMRLLHSVFSPSRLFNLFLYPKHCVWDLLSSYCIALLPNHCLLATWPKSGCICLLSRGNLHNDVVILTYKGMPILCVQCLRLLQSGLLSFYTTVYDISYIFRCFEQCLCSRKVWTKLYFSIPSTFYILQEVVSVSCKQEFCSGLAHKRAAGTSSPSWIWMPGSQPWHSLRDSAQKDICVALLSCHNERVCANKINEWTFPPFMLFPYKIWYFIVVLIQCPDNYNYLILSFGTHMWRQSNNWYATDII